MAEKTVVLTKEGLEKLELELETLKSVKRREIADRIKQAIEFGDISENSEYEDAKNEQAFIEGRILEVEKVLRNVELIEQSEDDDGSQVRLGSKVVLADLEYGDEVEYFIVGSAEADPMNNRISYESPVGEAIMGRQVGETVKVNAPIGSLKYEIVHVK